jgi:Tol biopolymer transport system component
VIREVLLLALVLVGSPRARAIVPGSPAANPDVVATRENAGIVFDPLENDQGPLVPGSVSIVVPPQHGTASVNPLTGYIRYQPAQGWSGEDSFRYQACDASLAQCRTAPVTARVKLWGNYRVLYHRHPPGSVGPADWWTNNPEGSDERRLPLGGGECALSPDRRQIACGLSVYDFDDLSNHVDVQVPDTIALVGQPRSLSWSPTGARVAFEALDNLSGATVFTYQVPLLAGKVNPLIETKLQSLTYQEGNDTLPVRCFDPHWGPSGIVCSGTGSATDPKPGIYRVTPGDKPTLVFEDAYAAQPCESADGRIVFKTSLTSGLVDALAVYQRGTSGIITSQAGIHTPRWSPDGTKIAAVTSDSPGRVVVLSADGSSQNWFSTDEARLNGSHFSAPGWDPAPVAPPPLPTRSGGAWLFARRLANGEPNALEAGDRPMLRRTSVEGSGETDFLSNPPTLRIWNEDETAYVTGCNDARWSPAGDRIACAPAAFWTRFVFPLPPVPEPQILVMNADRSEPRFLSPFPPGSAVRQLDWSPDGTRLVVAADSTADPESRDKLWALTDGGTDLQLLADLGTGPLGEIGAGWPSWSPDGTFIAFSTATLVGTMPSRWVVRADGSAPAVPLLSGPDEVFDRASWSPDGTRLAFSRVDRTSGAGAVPRIHTARFVAAPTPHLEDIQRLTRVPGFELHPIWSPDGQALAYLKGNGDALVGPTFPFQIRTVNVDGILELPVTDTPWWPQNGSGASNPALLGWSDEAQVDGDGDGIPEALDNCPSYASPDLTDTDGDSRGNPCECTDQNGDGRNTVSDLVAINAAIFNPSLVTPLCDGNNDSLCTVSDIVAANTEIFSPGNTSTCARQPVPGP